MCFEKKIVYLNGKVCIDARIVTITKKNPVNLAKERLCAGHNTVQVIRKIYEQVVFRLFCTAIIAEVDFTSYLYTPEGKLILVCEVLILLMINLGV